MAASLKVVSSSTPPFAVTKDTLSGDLGLNPPMFPILPFTKYPHNPILKPNPLHVFESAYVYNPTAFTLSLNGTPHVFLLYRAQGPDLISSIGLAYSPDGAVFTRLPHPVLSPTEPYETGGGCEDPRVVRVNSTFWMTYTAYDGETARLCMASSEDLLHWDKHGPLFPELGWTKSGAITSTPDASGQHHMYFGEGTFRHATSSDMLNWTVVTTERPFATPVYPWEDGLIEPGPAPVRTRDGKWLLIYNAKSNGHDDYVSGQYSVGQMLLDPEGSSHLPTGPQRQSGFRHDEAQLPLSRTSTNHDGPIARLETPFLTPTTKEEREGLVNNVVFAEGLVQFQGKWFLYYGQADSTIGVATAAVQP